MRTVRGAKAATRSGRSNLRITPGITCSYACRCMGVSITERYDISSPSSSTDRIRSSNAAANRAGTLALPTPTTRIACTLRAVRAVSSSIPWMMSSARKPTSVFPNSQAADALEVSPNQMRLSSLAASAFCVSPKPRASIASTTVPFRIHSSSLGATAALPLPSTYRMASRAADGRSGIASTAGIGMPGSLS